MTEKVRVPEQAGGANDLSMAVLNAIQNPVILVDENGHVAFANWEAESFFGASANHPRAIRSTPSFLSAARS